MIVQDMHSLQYVVEKCLNPDDGVLAFDTETLEYGFPHTTPVSFSVSWGEDKGAYIPFAHATGEMQLDPQTVYDAFRPVLENPNVTLVAHNWQYDMKVAKLMGITIGENIFDTMTASWLMDTEGSHGLKDLVNEIFGYKMTELADLCPKEKHPHWKNDKVYRVDLVPIKELGDYAYDDSVWCRKLYYHYKPLIDELYAKVYYDLEREFTVTLAEIEAYGAYVNKEKLKAIGEGIRSESAKAEQQIYMLRPGENCGVPFNINSGKQMNQVLFNECGIKPIGAPGKSGDYSTKAEILQKFADQGHEIAQAILRFRELDKLYGTYIVGMGGAITERGRIHCRFNRIGTKTGRLSSSKPNLQNIPNNAEFPIRDAFERTPAELTVNGKPKKLIVLD